MRAVRELVGSQIAAFINAPIRGYEPLVSGLDRVDFQLADVVLVEGDRRVSTAIKYLTQSTWSHAAIYIGDRAPAEHDKNNVLLEADVELGVITCSLSKYEHLNTRVCRPIGLSDEEKEKVVRHVTQRMGHKYDLKNITDLARFLWPMPPVPTSMRRKMITLGSGDPTRAICSTLIAEAFYSVNFPILPPPPEGSSRGASYTYVVPRDFDVSPYFSVIKPRMKASQVHAEAKAAVPTVMEEKQVQEGTLRRQQSTA